MWHLCIHSELEAFYQYFAKESDINRTVCDLFFLSRAVDFKIRQSSIHSKDTIEASKNEIVESVFAILLP